MKSSTRLPANILISVLWVILAMTILVMGLSFEARSDVERTLLFRERSKAYWLARAAVERVKFDYAASMNERMNIARSGNRGNGDSSNEQKSRYRYEFEAGFAECLLISDVSKMNLKSSEIKQWEQLFSLYGLDDQEQEEVAYAIRDWTDQDSEVSVNGAEDEYYQGLTPPYLPRNGPFQSVEEILLVRGVTEAMYYGSRVDGNWLPGLVDMLVLGTGGTRMDINSCPVGILMAFLELSEEEAKQIITRREEQVFENTQEVGEVVNINNPDNLNYFMTFRGAGQGFTIRATAYMKDSAARYTVEDKVRYMGGAELYQSLSHKDFSLEHVDETELEEEQ